MKSFFIIMSILIISITVNATTWYISPSGNNTNAGTQNSPWKTLVYACQNTSNGDIIHVLPGTYIETQIPQLGIGVSIEGEGITSIIESTVTGSEILSAQSPQKTNGNQHISGLKFDGQNLKSYQGVWISGRSNVSIYNCTIINFKEDAVIFNGVDIHNPGSDPVGLHATGNSFHDNIVTNCSEVNPGYGSGCFVFGGQDGMLIYNNNINQTARGSFGNGWPIKYWNEGWNKGCKIYNNILTKAPYQGSYPGENGAWDFCMEFFNVQGMEIYGNTIQGSIDFNYNYKAAYPYSIWIHNNTFNSPANTHVEGTIIFEYRTESAIVENNIINNKTYGISFNTRGYNDYGGDNSPNPGGTPAGGYSYITDCIIRNNLFSNLYNGSGVGNRFAIGVISESTNDPQINNLTIINNSMVAKSSDPCTAGMDFTSQGSGKITGISITQNIYQGFSNGSIIGQKAGSQTGVSITGNDYWQTNSPSWSGATISSNTNLNPNFDANYNNTLGIGYSTGNQPPPTPCTSYTYSAWSVCDATGTQTRTVISSIPAGCSGGTPPVLTQTCTPPPPSPCTYTYSGWSTCVNGTQTRTATSALPAGCTGTPVTSQTCTVNTPPTVSIGPDETFTITLGLSGNTTGNIVTYLWSKVSGPSGTPTFTPNNSLSTTVTNLKKGTYIFRLTVTDQNGLKASDDKTVIIQ